MVWLLVAAGGVLFALVIADVARRGRTNPQPVLLRHYWVGGLSWALLLAGFGWRVATY